MDTVSQNPTARTNSTRAHYWQQLGDTHSVRRFAVPTLTTARPTVCHTLCVAPFHPPQHQTNRDNFLAARPTHTPAPHFHLPNSRTLCALKSVGAFSLTSRFARDWACS